MGSLVKAFLAKKKIAKDYGRVEAMTKSDITGPSLFSSFFRDGLLYKTVDSSQISVSTSTYNYDREE